MASLKILDRECGVRGCTSRATHEIVRENFEQEGIYCRLHAGRRLIEVEREERAAEKAKPRAVES